MLTTGETRQHARVFFPLHQITVAGLLRCDASCLFWHCFWWCLVVVRVDQRPPASVCPVTAAVPPPPTSQPTLPPAVSSQPVAASLKPVAMRKPQRGCRGLQGRWCVWNWEPYNCMCGKNEWLALCISFCVRWQLVDSHLIKGCAVVVRDVVAHRHASQRHL